MKEQSVRIGGNDYNVKDDGVTHVNIYSGGATRLGRDLSNFTYFVNQTPHGEFSSMEGYYHYLKLLRSIENTSVPEDDIKDIVVQLETLRTKSGRPAQLLGRELRKRLAAQRVWIKDEPDSEFNQFFEAALLSRVINDPALRDRVVSNDLPYVHYYASTHYVHYKPHFDWLAERVMSVAEQIKEQYYDLSRTS